MAVDIEQVIRDYLPRIIHLSLATSDNNKPYVCEVHFAYDDQLNLYYRSLASRRHSIEIAKNPNVAGDIIVQHTLEQQLLGVYFEGQAKVLGPGDELNTAFECLNKRLKVSQADLEEAKDPNGHQFYKITISKWYVFGKFDGKPSQKYELSPNK